MCIKNLLSVIIFLSCTIILFGQNQNQDSSIVEFQAPSLNPERDIEATVADFHLVLEENVVKIQASAANGKSRIHWNGNEEIIEFANGLAPLNFDVTRKGGLHYFKVESSNGTNHKLYHISKNKDHSLRLKSIPLWLSLIPPIFAIFLALLFKEVVISLFAGIWIGAFIAGGLRIESLYFFIISIFDVVQKYIVSALIDSDHMSVIIFSLLIGAMVAIISKNGGMAGVVKSLSKYATSPRSTQFITWLLGVAIFFDDYANTLIVGNTMRSVTDRFKISREKLAYIVDSTAAPVAAIAFITTWIGAELGYIDDGLGIIGEGVIAKNSYGIFLESLKYSFYPFLTLSFILLLVWQKKDFGPMLKAERRARSTGQVSPAATQSEDEPNMEDLSPVPNAPLKWYNAVIPIAVVILITIYGLLDTGFGSLAGDLNNAGISLDSSGWRPVWQNLPAILEEDGFFIRLGQIIGSANSYTALLWSSLAGVLTAIVLTVGGKIIKLFDTMHYFGTGVKTMIPAIIILTLAWSLAITTKELHTADYLSTVLEGSINPYFLPAIIFVIAAFTSFSTGSSWSTMAILYPITIPTTWAICMSQGFELGLSTEILYNVISTVLAASVLGDHCSPISDTTILSSLASDCNHIDHVRTQLPYAIFVGIVALTCGILSTLLGGGWLISFILSSISIGIMWFVISRVGKPSENPTGT